MAASSLLGSGAVRPSRASGGVSRPRCLLLLATALLCMGVGLGSHAGHAAADLETPVFIDARHGGASHFEAAGKAVVLRCPDCLLTAQSHALAPARGACLRPLDPRRSLRARDSTPGSPPACQPSRPRAPPAS